MSIGPAKMKCLQFKTQFRKIFNEIFIKKNENKIFKARYNYTRYI